MKKFSFVALIISLSTCAMPVLAEMNRVYHPYVEQNERELEYGFTLRDLGGEQELA